MVYSDAVSQCVRLTKFWSVVTPRHMEDTTEPSVPCKSLAERIFLAKHVWRRKRICAALPKMSEAWEYKFPRRNGIEEQSSSGNIRHMGSRLHGSLPNVRVVRVQSCGSGLCVQMGWTTSLCCGRLEELKENVSRNHISSLRSSKTRDQRQSLTLHRQNL